jgi:DNA-binding protein WhiA
VNCETANLEKSLAAAWEQSELLTILEQRVGLNNLPKRLQETAKLRQIYPEATLKELGEYHLPPLSKSAVNHRWRQMREIAKKFQ